MTSVIGTNELAGFFYLKKKLSLKVNAKGAQNKRPQRV